VSTNRSLHRFAGGLSVPNSTLPYGRLVRPFFTSQIALNFTRRAAGLAVIIFVARLAKRILRSSEPALRCPGLILLCSLLLQACLGAIAICSRTYPVPTTLHIALGAVTLVSCLRVNLNTHRILVPRGSESMASRTPGAPERATA
jgi:heme A synthase